MSQRKSHTCVDCSRRKIRCDKVIPCSNCTKKGRAHTCRRVDDPPLPAELQQQQQQQSPGASPGYERIIGFGPSSAPPEKDGTLAMVSALADRVQQLEAALQMSKKRSAPPEEPHPAEAQLGFATTSEPGSIKQPRLSHRGPRPTSSLRAEDQPHEESQNSSEAEVEDAATVLEFLAWGRLKDSAATTSIRNTKGDQVLTTEPLQASGLDSWGASPSSGSGGVSFQVETAQLVKIQEMLPSKERVYQMVDFHEDWLLWLHAAWIAPIFNEELDEFYSLDNGTIGITSSKVQWAGMLFAILTTSITCARRKHLEQWGYTEVDQSVLSRRWYQASVDCLHIAKYQQNHLIYSGQAIATLTIAAHIIGFSNAQSILIASAIRIAQALGLHRLKTEKGENMMDLKTRRQKEAGRRLWQQLVTQDWFSVPFSESYCVNPLHFTSSQPLVADEKELRPVTPGEPGLTAYVNFLFPIAGIMPRLLDRMAQAQTLHAKYKEILYFDKKMRHIATTQMPDCLNTQKPVDPSWPCWIANCRRNLTVTSAHKIIMIHRTFLGLSFSDPHFAFTRRTCIAAAKTILNNFKLDTLEQAPLLWTMQAFAVAASIILTLDNFNLSDSTQEYSDHREMVRETIDILQTCVGFSTVAARGVRLLTDLLAEERTTREAANTGRNKTLSPPERSSRSQRGSTSLNVSAFVKKFCEADQPVPPSESPVANTHIPLWLHNNPPPDSNSYPEDMMSRHDSLGDHQQNYPSRPAASNMNDLAGYNSGYSASTYHAQEHFGNPFGPGFPENFDIRTMNWYDDMLGIPPSNAL